ncbi:unnamed protein product [Gongylonema pulchrum]|uniref:Uncharacterized protein n=1 Tax=Gongylonema pulchrum TaxID=637853 RepID=A0A183DKZ6_9BILA|nr:unnamed protein product [Gongylonema pulchrum]
MRIKNGDEGHGEERVVGWEVMDSKSLSAKIFNLTAMLVLRSDLEEGIAGSTAHFSPDNAMIT